MITFSTDENFDVYLSSSGRLSMDTGINAISTTAKGYASTLLGEMMHMIDQGVPYLSGGNIRRALYQRLASVPGVVAVRKLDITQVNDVLKYTATLSTIYGDVVSNGNL